MESWTEVSWSSAKEGALITAIDVAASFVAAAILHVVIFDVLGFVLLIEAVALMLVGGALDLGGAASTRRREAIIRRRKFEWSAADFKKVEARGAF